MKNKVTLLLSTFFLIFSVNIFADTIDQSVVSYVSDSITTAFIKTKLAVDKNINNSDVNVTTTNGVVTLAGAVNSQFEIAELKQLAASTSGVKQVDTTNLIIKKSRQPFKDCWITLKTKLFFLKEKLINKKQLPFFAIHVETHNGIVYLSGNVKNLVEAQNATMLAQSIDGVDRVVSVMKIQ